jgi:hypothetical protein
MIALPILIPLFGRPALLAGLPILTRLSGALMLDPVPGT